MLLRFDHIMDNEIGQIIKDEFIPMMKANQNGVTEEAIKSLFICVYIMLERIKSP